LDEDLKFLLTALDTCALIFLHAADSHNTEPTLSQQVRQLEEQLGFELLDRPDEVRTR
jgi:Bacterial regulatory helix-turn-helix protein, lysR family